MCDVYLCWSMNWMNKTNKQNTLRMLIKINKQIAGKCILRIWSSETRESLQQFLFADNLGLFPSISSQFILLPKIAKKITKNLYLLSSKSFKVIAVNIPKKLIASACYNKPHFCAYLQPFFMLDQPIVVKQPLLGGTPLWHSRPQASLKPGSRDLDC